MSSKRDRKVDHGFIKLEVDFSKKKIFCVAISIIACCIAAADYTTLRDSDPTQNAIRKRIQNGEIHIGFIVRLAAIESLKIFYPVILIYFALLTQVKPFKISRFVRWLLDSGFVIACLALPEYIKDDLRLRMWLSLCFQIIPLANLFTCVKKSGILRWLLTMLLAYTIHHFKYGGDQQNIWPIVIILIMYQSAKHLDRRSLNNTESKGEKGAHIEAKDHE